MSVEVCVGVEKWMVCVGVGFNWLFVCVGWLIIVLGDFVLLELLVGMGAYVVRCWGKKGL